VFWKIQIWEQMWESVLQIMTNHVRRVGGRELPVQCLGGTADSVPGALVSQNPLLSLNTAYRYI